jgi:hypothetical protein
MDWIYKLFDKDNLKKKIAEYIVKRRKNKNSEQFYIKTLSEKSIIGKYPKKKWEEIEK